MMQESERMKGESHEWFSVSLEGLSPKTRGQYLSKFHEFLEWTDRDTESLLEEHEANLRSDDKRRKKLIPKLVYDFQRYRINECGDKVASSRTILKAVRKFFLSNEATFSMNGLTIRPENDSQVINEIPIIQKSELKTMLEVCGSIRLKSIIYTARDSGLRISDVCRITMKHVQPALEDPSLEYHTFEIIPQKNMRKDQPLKANPVIGPDAIKWIKRWLTVKEEMGITSPLLYTSVQTVRPHTHEDGSTHKTTERGEPLSPSNAGVMFRQLRDKAGLREAKVSIHSLRKYHKTNLEYGGCPTSWINRMQGRRGSGTGGTYTKPNEAQIIDLYAQAYQALTLETDATAENRQLLGRLQELENLVHRRDNAYEAIDPDLPMTTEEELAHVRKLTDQLLKAQNRLDERVAQLANQ